MNEWGLMMMDYTESSHLRMVLKDRKLERGAFIGHTTGVVYPMDQIPADRLRLDAFAWFDYVRPLSKEDIFNWRGKGSDKELRVVKKSKIPLPTLDRFK
jgi:hypothetical protein